MKSSIMTKVILILIAFIAIGTSVSTYFLIRLDEKFMTAEMEERANALTDNLAKNCEYGLVTLNKENLNNLVNSTLQQKDIYSVQIENDRKEILIKAVNSGINGPFKEFVKPITTEQQKGNADEMLLLNVKREKKQIGNAVVVLSWNSLNSKINVIKITSVTFAFIVIIVTIITSVWFINRYVSYPIRQLVLGIQKIAAGDMDTKVELASNDEFGALAVFFNAMTEDLKKSKMEIEKYSKTLEQKVEARTKELKESEAVLQVILDSMPVGVVIIGRDKIVRRANRTALGMMGRKLQEEIIGGSCYGVMCPDEKDACPILDLKQKVDASESLLITGDGKSIPVMKSVVSVVLNNEEVLLEAFIDITMLKRAEQEKEKLQSQLIQSEKLSAIGQLAAGVAHEINNPMGVILGFAQGIVRDFKEGDVLYMPLKSIEREAIRCKKLVQDLLIFSRTGKVQSEQTDINAVIDDTLSLIEAQAKVRNVVIIREYGQGLPQIMINKNQIQQVIVNLCNNAMDAMPGGGRITITTKQAGQYVELDVADTGSGMTEEVKKHLFEPFYTTKEAGKGTGLGLSLCYDIIKKHNGTIEPVSVAGKGTKFIIMLRAD